MKKRIKQIIGVIIGIIIGISTTVGATTIFNSKDITYSSDKTSKTNVKDSLDELYNKAGKCPEGQYCYTAPVALSDKVELGDYIRMTPTSTSYTISKDLTGYTSDQTINPSELNIWRVIKKNEDGTVDAVSVYSSEDGIYFYGVVGYTNYIGALKILASSYSNSKYVFKTRYISYQGQEEHCKSYQEEDCQKYKFPSEDLSLINKVFGTYLTNQKSGKNLRYWGGFREGPLGQYWIAGVGNEGGSTCIECGYLMLRFDDDGSLVEMNGLASLRPIITLKSDIKLKNGDGKSESTAYEIE